MSVLKGRRAVVTGASSGLGVDFARQLAALGADLTLVARREDRLRGVREELVARHPVAVDIVCMDLVAPGAAARLHEQVRAAGQKVDVLVNNAGLGLYGEFLEIPWERERQMLELDIVTLVELCKLFLPGMVARDFGYVLNVSSIGAYQATPLYASYSAAKAFVLSFSEALSYELRKTRVRVTALSPGITATEFLKVSGQKATLYQRMMLMRSDEVVRIGIEAMLAGKPSVVPGFLNALSAFSMRLLPRRLAAAIAYLTMKSERAERFSE